MNETKDLTTGSVFGTLIKFGVPIFIAMFVQSLYGAVDLLIVGQFASTADVSGVATGSVLIQTFTMVVTSLATGITIYVGQKIGEKNMEAAGKAIGAGVALFLVISVALSVIIVALNKQLAMSLHTPEEAFEQTCAYVIVCGLGMVFVVMYNLLGAIFRGIGDSKTPLMIVLIACVCNIVGDLLLVAVLPYGAMGAAIATVVAQAISVVLSLLIIAKKSLPFEFHLKFIRMDREYVGRILKLGTPIALQELLVGLSFIVIQAVVNSINVTASAGVGVAEKVCAFIMLVPSAFSQAMSAFVAQNVGAGKPKRAGDALRVGIISSLCVAAVIGTFSFIRGDLLASIFTKDAAVVVQAHSYLKAYAVDTFFTSFLFCFIGYYNGYGNTLFVMIQGIVGGILVRLPLVLLFSSFEGATLFSIGLATPCATVVQILMCLGFMCYLNRKKRLDK